LAKPEKPTLNRKPDGKSPKLAEPAREVRETVELKRPVRPGMPAKISATGEEETDTTKKSGVDGTEIDQIPDCSEQTGQKTQTTHHAPSHGQKI